LEVQRDIVAKTKIAIACQGAGSQTAFTAGVLKALCEAKLQDEFEFVSISGTLMRLLAERKPIVIDPLMYSWGRSIPGAVG
jgi:hypothetical protein